MIWALIVLFFVLLFAGVPVAFSMSVISAIALLLFDVPLTMLIQKMHSALDSFPFLALPFFILAGSLMETGGISTRLVNLARAMVGHLRGGLGMVVCIAEVFFSGISGSSIADASAIGSMLIPNLKRSGYSEAHSVSIVNAATGMGHLIPPCTAMVILAVLGNLSIAALFFAGLLPGLFMTVTLMTFIYLQARRGILPGSEGAFSLRSLARTALSAIIPLIMPLIIFGGILGGVGTATEVAVLAVIYSLLVGLFIYKEIKIADLPRIFMDTVKIVGGASLLLGSAALFSWILATQRVPDIIGQVLLSSTSSPYVFLVIVGLVFVVACALMDGLPALLIFYPILLPVAKLYGIHPIHFTIVAVAAQGIGIILPPLGIVFFVTCSISKTSPASVIRTALPYVSILILTFFAILLWPWLVLIIPRLFIPGFH
jgi:C4-dicarboxylate transporter, DctM subunit